MANQSHNKIWTLEQLELDAKKYQYRSDWAKANGSAYLAAYRSGLLDHCCAHMKAKPLPVKWTKQACIADAAQYSTKSEWFKHSGSAYNVARKNNWFPDCCKHMVRPTTTGKRIRRKDTMTKQYCMLQAKKYTRRIDWQTQDRPSYRFAYHKGWLDECCQHMPILMHTFTKQSCLEDAQQYPNVSEWKNANSKAYWAASRNGWLEDCTAHMTKKKKWTKQACIDEAAKHARKKDWEFFSSTSYTVASMNGWIDECCQHMQPTSFRWTLGRCLADISKYTSVEEWKNASPSAFVTASMKGWLDKCSSHLLTASTA